MKTEAELKGIFTQAEWSALADTFCSTIMDEQVRDYSSVVVAGLEDAEKCDGTMSRWNVDLGALSSKVRTLTPRLNAALCDRIAEFWADDARDMEKWSRF